MSNKYKDYMNKIVVDEDMKNRIMLNLQNMDKDEVEEVTIKRNHGKIIRNLGLAAACAALVVSIGAVKSYYNEEIIENIVIENCDEVKEFAVNEDVSEVPDVPEVEEVQEVRDIQRSVQGEKPLNKPYTRSNYIESKPEVNYVEDHNVISEEGVADIPENEVVSNSDNDITNNAEVIPDSNEDVMYISLNDDIEDSNVDSNGKFIRNSITSFENLEELKEKAGFEFKVSSFLENNYNRDEMNIALNEIVHITYVNNDEVIDFKVCEGENNISSSYDLAKKSVSHNNINYNLQSEADNVKSVSWNENNMSYYIECEPGLDEGKALKIAQDLKTVN